MCTAKQLCFLCAVFPVWSWACNTNLHVPPPPSLPPLQVRTRYASWYFCSYYFIAVTILTAVLTAIAVEVYVKYVLSTKIASFPPPLPHPRTSQPYNVCMNA
jgi:hypothetical protein